MDQVVACNEYYFSFSRVYIAHIFLPSLARIKLTFSVNDIELSYIEGISNFREFR